MPIGSVQLVSKSEYARRRGCTEAAVRRAVRDGRISLIEGRVDPIAADAQWQRNTRVRIGSRASSDVPPAESAKPDSVGDEQAGNEYWSVKVRRERAEAEMAELKLSELRGDMVRLAAVRATWSRFVSGMRESMLQMPARVVPLLVAEPSPEAMDKILNAEIATTLAVISGSDQS